MNAESIFAISIVSAMIAVIGLLFYDIYHEVKMSNYIEGKSFQYDGKRFIAADASSSKVKIYYIDENGEFVEFYLPKEKVKELIQKQENNE